MVECSPQLDLIFASLAHPIRRDILRRGEHEEMSVSELAVPYGVSIAAISKHIQILEKAGLISKRRRGKQQFVTVSGTAFRQASAYLKHYENLWNGRLNLLEQFLAKL